ncbi:MAG: hypothetical protein KAG61_08685 [Bacteriovoracaceae bacterium]|nr:hypothetical protein [Bacteriovoracaceae bacterium]
MKSVHEFKSAIKDLVSRRGKVEKNSLIRGVCQILGIDQEEYNEKTFYRHMKELVDAGELSVEKDELTKKNYWFIYGAEAKNIPNSGLIEEHNGAVYFSPLIAREASVGRGVQSHNNTNEIHVYFNINHDFLCLRINRDAVPFKLHLARKADGPMSNVIEKVNESFGKRTSLLHLPIARLSSIKDTGDTGHACLEFGMDGVKITDLSSTNGSLASRISHQEAHQLLKDGDLIGKSTINEEWFKTGAGSIKLDKIKSKSSLDFDYPVLAQFSSDFKVLIYLPE